MKKSIKIALILGIVVVCLLAATLILTFFGKFYAGYYLAYKVNADKVTCTVTKCIPLGAKEITVPETIGRYRVSEVDSYAFANRTKLTDITLPDGLESIGIGAFYECENLKKIKIPNSVTSVGSYAFFGCESLTSITLSANTREIGARVFEGCTSITDASVPASAIATLPPENITAVEVNSGKSIGNYAFKNFAKLTTITISPSVEKIGLNAFKGCKSITSATLPAELISFIPRDKLTCIVINGGTHIPERACYYFSHLTSITLPQSIISIGNRAFEGCYQLAEIYNFSPIEIEIGSSDNGGIARYALHISTSPEESCRTWADENGYLFYEGDDACYLLGYMGEETELTLPEGPNGRDYIIRAYAFYINASLTSVTLPESVVKIEENAFAHCRSIETMTFPNSLVSIGKHAFYECDELSQISLGKNITTIGAHAFDDCDNLAHIAFRGTTEEWKSIELGSYWIFYAPVTEIVCTDGAMNLK